jgi:hypothetical protein
MPTSPLISHIGLTNRHIHPPHPGQMILAPQNHPLFPRHNIIEQKPLCEIYKILIYEKSYIQDAAAFGTRMENSTVSVFFTL